MHKQLTWSNVDERILLALKDENQDDVREYLDEVHDYGDETAFSCDNDLDLEYIREDFKIYLQHRSM